MSVVQGNIIDGALAGTTVNIELPTVRVPELPVAVDPQGTDEIILYQENGNKTTRWNLDGIVGYIVTGDNPVTQTPVIYGADVEIVVAESEDKNANGAGGNSRISRTALANKMFALERRATGQLLTTEFTNLSSGGFDLKSVNGVPQKVHAGEVFIAHVFDYVAQPPSTSTSSGRFNGIVKVVADTQLAEPHRNKLISLEFGTAHGTLTLEDIADAPLNSEVVIKTTVTNFDSKIVCKAGQKIYGLNTSLDYIYLARGEAITLAVFSDGYYIDTPADFLINVGRVEYGYRQGINQLIGKGQLLNRADYPRLWLWVQSLGFSLVTDDVWNTVTTITGLAGTRTSYKPYEGCYSYGPDGVNGLTFRLPNLQEKFVRGLNNINSTDPERSFNYSGSIQPDTNKKHDHGGEIPLTEDMTTTSDGSYGKFAVGNGGPDGPFNFNLSIPADGSYESRGINVGLLPLINT